MTVQELAQIYRPDELKSIEDVIALLAGLGERLEGGALTRLTIFNRAYLIVTEAISAARAEFEDFSAMQRLDIVFVCYYAEALERYLKSGATVPAWQAEFEACRGGGRRMQALALGVNAHINNDLGQSLRDAGGVTPADYELVNRLIARVGPKIIAGTGIGLGPLSGVEAAAMTWLVRRWRGYAWRVYRGLAEGSTHVTGIEKEALKRGQIIDKIPWPR